MRGSRQYGGESFMVDLDGAREEEKAARQFVEQAEKFIARSSSTGIEPSR